MVKSKPVTGYNSRIKLIMRKKSLIEERIIYLLFCFKFLP